MKTFVYVDGYNFYYRSLKNTPHKWLDLSKFCNRLLPNNEITRINYYTARATPQPTNPDVGKRQWEYLRALMTLPTIKITYGQFRAHPQNLPLFDSLLSDELQQKKLLPSKYNFPKRVRFSTVLKTEEKGSDVNLASHLIYEAVQKKFEVAFVFSNDSDLAEPIRIVNQELNIPVYVYVKDTLKPAHELKNVAKNVYHFRNSDLADCQFPKTFLDAKGRPIEKPLKW